jgi:fimbrial isopeptide formation D2 family protein
MQNTTTQPQNFYTKPGMPAPAPVVNPNNTPNPVNNNRKSKRVFAIAGLVLFLIVAVMGVFIAQRQIAKDGQDTALVAPNAPESQPDASTDIPNNCATLFSVPNKKGVCNRKSALNYFSTKGGEVINDGKFNVGDSFVFQIIVGQPKDGLATDIKVIDILPDSLTFSEGLESPDYTITNEGQTVTAFIPKLEKGKKVIVEFKVLVNSTKYGKSVNSALISGSKQNAQCTEEFTVLKGTTECISKEIYDSTGTLISNGAALTRGEEYEYRINVKVTNKSLGEVKIIDELPTELEFVKISADSTKYVTNDPASGTITANFGVLEDEDKISLGFIMKVPNNIEPTDFENIAKVYAFPENSRQPEPPQDAEICKVANVILPIGSAQCVSKEAYRITNLNNSVIGEEILAAQTVQKGEHFLYKLTVKAEDTTTGPVIIIDELPTDLKFIEDSLNTPGIVENPNGSGKLSFDLDTMQTGQEETIQFLVQVVANPTATTFENVALVSTNGNDSTPHSCALPLELKKEYSCNTDCETDDQCNEIGENYICHTTDNGDKFCRLDGNEEDLECKSPSCGDGTVQDGEECDDGNSINDDSCSNACKTPYCGDGILHTSEECDDGNNLNGDACSAECTKEVATPPPTEAPTPTPTTVASVAPTPVPTPTLGCNDECTQNADCSNVEHICVTVDKGTNKCRLADYTSSDTCTEPVIATVLPSSQPVLPTELPQSGPEDWLNWLKAGLVTFGIGTALFLLL